MNTNARDWNDFIRLEMRIARIYQVAIDKAVAEEKPKFDADLRSVLEHTNRRLGQVHRRALERMRRG